MTAFSNFHLSVAGALAPRASVFPARRTSERLSIRFAAAAVRASAAAGEIGMFLCLALAIAFALLVMAGFFVAG
jgi:hypothetical protein